MPSAHPRLQLAFLTGQSDPTRCALSPQQRAFGQALLGPRRVLHPCNFPYDGTTLPFRATPLLSASWHNSWHYLRSRRAAFAHAHRAAIAGLLQSAPHTLLLVGSCGLELLANLDLPQPLAQRVSVFAYGPVARRAPAVAALQVVIGRHDWISRLGWRGAYSSVDSSHLQYLLRPEVLAIARRFSDAIEQRAP